MEKKRRLRVEAHAIEVLHEVGGLLKGHFLLTSGRHSGEYANKDAIFARPEKVEELCDSVVEDGPFEVGGIDVVAGPAVGGAILAQWIAYRLSDYREIDQEKIRAAYAEKGPGDTFFFSSDRGYDKVINGKRVLVVDDVLTTGGSIIAVRDAV